MDYAEVFIFGKLKITALEILWFIKSCPRFTKLKQPIQLTILSLLCYALCSIYNHIQEFIQKLYGPPQRSRPSDSRHSRRTRGSRNQVICHTCKHAHTMCTACAQYDEYLPHTNMCTHTQKRH